jgi:hypothetical protein
MPLSYLLFGVDLLNTTPAGNDVEARSVSEGMAAVSKEHRIHSC